MNKFRVELSIDAENATYFFDRLQKQQNDIEQELGYPLKWEDKKPQTKRRRIAVYEDADPKDKKDWPRQHQWLAEKLNEFHRVFANRVKNLNPDDWRAEEENET